MSNLINIQTWNLDRSTRIQDYTIPLTQVRSENKMQIKAKHLKDHLWKKHTKGKTNAWDLWIILEVTSIMHSLMELSTKMAWWDLSIISYTSAGVTKNQLLTTFQNNAYSALSSKPNGMNESQRIIKIPWDSAVTQLTSSLIQKTVSISQKR